MSLYIAQLALRSLSYVCIVGATGNTGVQILRQALERGHAVKALVRSPEKVEIQHANLQVVLVLCSEL